MGKKAFITGGSRGIGRGIVLQLAQNGYDVAFTYHSAIDEAKSLQSEIHKLGQRCFFYQASLEQSNIPEMITAQAIHDLGGIDVLICNAGKTKFTSITTLNHETVDFLYNLDYKSYLLCTKTAVNHMIENGHGGRIIFITSTRGIRAYRNDAVYGSLKAALNRAVESLAIELAEHHITVNAVAPGATQVRGDYTDEQLRAGHLPSLIPLNRKGKPQDVSALVGYLVSDAAEYITGETIKVDGGLILYGPNENKEGGMY